MTRLQRAMAIAAMRVPAGAEKAICPDAGAESVVVIATVVREISRYHPERSRSADLCGPRAKGERPLRVRRRNFHSDTRQWARCADCVEKVGLEVNRKLLDRGGSHGSGDDKRAGLGCFSQRRHRDQLGQLAEVLGGGGEVEFVARTVWPA